MIRLAEIKGLLPDLRDSNEDMVGFNAIIKSQGSRKITLNREKLAIVLFAHETLRSGLDFKDMQHYWNLYPQELKEKYYLMVDAIINALPELVEVVG